MTTHPRIQVSVDGVPVSGGFFERLVSLTIFDREGIQSDTIDLVFNDAPPHLQSPRRGAVIEVTILGGSSGSFAGAYVIDRVEFICLPYTIEVKGHSADLKAGMKTNRTKHWDKVSVKELVQEKADDHGIEAKISDAVSGHVYEWIGQQDESDLHFLERLAKRHGAFFTIKNGVLLWLERGKGEKADGSAIPTVTIRRPVVVERSLRVSETDSDRFATIKAYYRTHHAAAKTDGEVATGDEVWDILGGEEGTSTRQAVVIKAAEDGAGEKVLKETYGSRAEALRAAKAAKREMERAQIETSCTLIAHPDLQAGQPISYEGIRPQVDGREFILDTVRHSYTKSGGLRTAFKGKLKADEEGDKSAAKKSGSGGSPESGSSASTATTAPSTSGGGAAATSAGSVPTSQVSGGSGLAAGAGAALGGLAALRGRRRR